MEEVSPSGQTSYLSVWISLINCQQGLANTDPISVCISILGIHFVMTKTGDPGWYLMPCEENDRRAYITTLHTDL